MPRCRHQITPRWTTTSTRPACRAAILRNRHWVRCDVSRTTHCILLAYHGSLERYILGDDETRAKHDMASSLPSLSAMLAQFSECTTEHLVVSFESSLILGRKTHLPDRSGCRPQAFVQRSPATNCHSAQKSSSSSSAVPVRIWWT